MPEDRPTDDVAKFLSEQKSLEDRKQALIADLLKQREAAIMAFDEKLAKLGYHAPENSARLKRSHHKPSASGSPGAQAKPKVKV